MTDGMILTWMLMTIGRLCTLLISSLVGRFLLYLYTYLISILYSKPLPSRVKREIVDTEPKELVSNLYLYFLYLSICWMKGFKGMS